MEEDYETPRASAAISLWESTLSEALVLIDGLTGGPSSSAGLDWISYLLSANLMSIRELGFTPSGISS